jgi:hypothetical protein
VSAASATRLGDVAARRGGIEGSIYQLFFILAISLASEIAGIAARKLRILPGALQPAIAFPARPVAGPFMLRRMSRPIDADHTAADLIDPIIAARRLSGTSQTSTEESRSADRNYNKCFAIAPTTIPVFIGRWQSSASAAGQSHAQLARKLAGIDVGALHLGLRPYYDAGAESVDELLPLTDTPVIAAQFDPAAVQGAVKAIQREEIGYADFLRRIMEAKCSSYQVFFNGRKAMYLGGMALF